MRKSSSLWLLFVLLACAVVGVSASDTVAAPAPCTITGYVVMQFYHSDTTSPTTNGCWTFDRTKTETSTFTIGHSDGTHTGSGGLKVYDDVNSSHGNDTTEIVSLLNLSPATTNLWMEDIANGNARDTPSGTTFKTVTYYAYEMYTGDASRDSGSDPSGDVPVINLTPDLANDMITDKNQLIADVTGACADDETGSGSFTVSLYADADIDSIQAGWINTALDDCFS